MTRRLSSVEPSLMMMISAGAGSCAMIAPTARANTLPWLKFGVTTEKLMLLSVPGDFCSGFCLAQLITASRLRHEGYHPRRRKRNALIPDHVCDLQTVAAGLRQADDLLSALGAAACRHSRRADHHYAERPAVVQSPVARRAAVRHVDQLRRAAAAGR